MERTKMQRMGIGLALAALVSTTPVLAQQAIHPTITGETGLFETLSGTTAGPGDWTFGLYLNNFDRVIDFGTGEDSIDIYQLGASVGYGFTEALEMSILLPWQKLDNGPDPDGLANARLGMKYQFSGDDTSGVALNAFVTLPTGDEDVAPDDTGYGVGIAWNDGNWFAGGEYAVLGDFDGFDVKDQIKASVGFAAPISERFFWLTELVGRFWAGSGNELWDDSVDLVTGGRVFWNENWAFNFGLRTDLMQWGDFSDYCPLGGLLGLTYMPSFAKPEPPAPPPPPPAPAPEAAPAPAPPPPPPAPTEEQVTIPFDAGARLNNIAKARLDEVALRMRQDPDITAHVIGHADATGGEEANLRLSHQRAEAVKDYLVSRHGIDGSRISTDGRGEAEPVATNDTAEGRAQNRRAEVILRIQ